MTDLTPGQLVAVLGVLAFTYALVGWAFYALGQVKGYRDGLTFGLRVGRTQGRRWAGDEWPEELRELIAEDYGPVDGRP